MSSLFLESRVVITRVRHSNVGREDMNSFISRQHIANPRPLLHVSTLVRMSIVVKVTYLLR